MFVLKEAVITNYKSYIGSQSLEFEQDVTALVGKNESGKTACLEALAKVNYFETDEDFVFDEDNDFPRNKLKQHQRSGADEEVIVCTFQLDQQTLDDIEADLGKGVMTTDQFRVSSMYRAGRKWYSINADEKRYLKSLQSRQDISDQTVELLQTVKLSEIAQLEDTEASDNSDESELHNTIQQIKSDVIDYAMGWDNALDGYIVNTYIRPNLPRFWYFDEYHELPSRISIDAIQNNTVTEGITKKQLETAKALFEYAMVDVNKLTEPESFESFTAELEAASNDITDQVLDYWSTNKELSIQFKIDQVPRGGHQPYEKILDIRVWNDKHRVSIPLKNRSKGFNWFFSFIVWFSRIQDDKDKNFILLLDEPGLNLHASAQSDLLRFIKDLSKEYQIVYTTHSPFMVDSEALHRVRTIYDSDKGSVVSDTIKEKDPDTLFPLQAALGYDLAQNLFVSKKNLLVEGPSDLIYIKFMSSQLDRTGRTSLRNDVTIVPVGGLDRVASFVSLLRGSNLKTVCLLDTDNKAKGKQKLQNLIKAKIIKDKNVRFIDEFAGDNFHKADIEDLFSIDEYVRLFSHAYPDYKEISAASLGSRQNKVIPRIKALLKGKKFDHYEPSMSLHEIGVSTNFFSEETFDRFEEMFKEINKLF